MVFYLITGILVGYMLPHYKIYAKVCDCFSQAMRKRDQKINELMVENNSLRKQQGCFDEYKNKN
jgi:hypothetical protein